MAGNSYPLLFYSNFTIILPTTATKLAGVSMCAVCKRNAFPIDVWNNIQVNIEEQSYCVN